MKQRLIHWWPAPASIDAAERLRSCMGALLGVLLTGLASAWLLGSSPQAIWLMAPMGASAVLLFAVPTSPLAQPWSIVGGNVVAALVGVSCAKFIADPAAAAGVAIFLAIGAMLALRCLHPPSGAVALMAVVGGAPIREAGYGFVLSPVALNTVLMLAAALAYNRAIGRRYPQSAHVAVRHPHQTADVDVLSRMGFTPDDLHGALQATNQLLDISEEDLGALIRKTEMRAYDRHYGPTPCADVMSSDVLSVQYGTELEQAWQMMQSHTVRALPIVDRARRVIGIVTRGDFLRHADRRDDLTMGSRLRRFLRRTPHTHSDKHEVVGQIMSTPVRTATAATPIVELVPLMADSGLHHVPIVDEAQRLVGIVTQTDLVAALYETSLGRLVPASRTNPAPR